MPSEKRVAIFVGLRGSSYFITYVATSTGIYSTAIRESVDSLCRDDTDGWIAYCVFVVVFYPLSTPPPLERPVRFRYGNRQNRPRFRHHLLLLQTTYSSTGI